MTRRKRRTISGQQKVEIVKRHLVDQVPVSQLCEEYLIQPTQFYQWQKQLFENRAGSYASCHTLRGTRNATNGAAFLGR